MSQEGTVLHALVGSPPQVKWARIIRNDAMTTGRFDTEALADLLEIIDSSWWIANRHDLDRGTFKAPSPWQLVGGPPPPPKPTRRRAPEIDEPDESLVHPPKAIDSSTKSGQVLGFAKSVSQNAALAEVAIVALMAKVYHGETSRQLYAEAKRLLDEVSVMGTVKLAKDLDGVTRIFNTIDKES